MMMIIIIIISSRGPSSSASLLGRNASPARALAPRSADEQKHLWRNCVEDNPGSRSFAQSEASKTTQVTLCTGRVHAAAPSYSVGVITVPSLHLYSDFYDL